MDNLTHSLVGAALAETGLKRWTPLAATALILGANFPDIDIFVGFNKLTYLEHHRGITHAIVAIPLLSLLLAGLLYAGSRWWQRRHPSQYSEKADAKFGPLFGLSFLAMCTHPLLDFTNSYGWRPFLPWSHQWYYGDIDFVVDPWLWASLGGSLMLVTATTRPRFIAWSALFVVLTIPVIMFAGTPWEIKATWMGTVALCFSLWFFLRLNQATAQWLIRGILIVVLLYFATLTRLQRSAVAEIAVAAPTRIQPEERVTQVDAMPIPANPLLWRTVISTDKAFYFSDLPLFSSSLPTVRRYDRESGEATAIAAAKREPEFQAFLRFARFPTITARQQQDRTTEVEIRDARFYDLDSSTNSTFRTSLRFDTQMRRVVE